MGTARPKSVFLSDIAKPVMMMILASGAAEASNGGRIKGTLIHFPENTCIVKGFSGLVPGGSDFGGFSSAGFIYKFRRRKHSSASTIRFSTATIHTFDEAATTRTSMDPQPEIPMESAAAAEDIKRNSPFQVQPKLKFASSSVTRKRKYSEYMSDIWDIDSALKCYGMLTPDRAAPAFAVQDPATYSPSVSESGESSPSSPSTAVHVADRDSPNLRSSATSTHLYPERILSKDPVPPPDYFFETAEDFRSATNAHPEALFEYVKGVQRELVGQWKENNKLDFLIDQLNSLIISDQRRIVG
ncbi:unnamed protein product [Diplocarpon coronariae]